MKKIVNYFQKNLWLGPILIGIAVRFYKLTYSSIWHDEGYTMWLIRYGFWDIIKRDIRDVHPPGYYLISKIWVSLFGSSVFSIRFLSLIFSVGIIYLLFLMIKKLFNERAAFWSAMFLALSPFMIRFGQEARMYGVVAFFTTLATYFLVNFIYEKKSKWLIWYALAMIVAVYNQYYAFFVVISHWVILAIATPCFFKFHWVDSFKKRIGIFNFAWWIANISIVLAYLPWFPIAYRQVTRISGSYWIKPEWINIRTIPGNLLQFITYTHMDEVFNFGFLGRIFYWLVILILIGAGLYLLKKKENRAKVVSLYVFGYLPMLLVFTLSKIRTPIYQDRYFPFSAIALFAIWGVAIAYLNNKKLRIVLGTVLIIILLVGNYAMHYNVNHKMKQVVDVVKHQKQSNDVVLSGELYTFLDGSYYFNYQDFKLLSEPMDGYGESSLFYDQQNKYVVNPTSMNVLGNRIWLIGKSGKDYFTDNKWSDWSSATYFEGGGLRAVLYTR